MTGSTISGYIGTTVTLGVGYTSPLTITSFGDINPSQSNYSSTGIYLPASKTIGTILNHGFIFGGIGGYNDVSGRAGGVGILLDSTGFVNNTNRITGGGGDSGGRYAGAGGIAIDVLAFSTISNTSSGVITGGNGGYAYNQLPSGYFQYGAAGFGGAAVGLQVGATFNNAGLVLGGTGGNAEEATDSQLSGGNGVSATADVTVNNSGTIVGGSGGIEGEAATPAGTEGGQGVSMDGLGKLVNSGAIFGGAGGAGSNVVVGGGGNEGVFLDEATATNTGVITGGAGALGSIYGGGGGLGVAVYNYASLSNSKGNITGGAGGQGGGTNNTGGGGGGGGSGVIVSSYGTVNNTGHITGGAGGYAGGEYTRGGGGGTGVYLDSGKLSNSSAITGGNGGTENGSGTTYQSAGAGGIGVAAGPGSGYLRGNAAIINYGAIRGGNGGNIDGAGGIAGAGGAGVSIADATLTNHGTITGGIGGYAGQGALNYGYGGAGGAGVVVGIGGKVNNMGTVIGGIGGANVYGGTVGGAGVDILGGTFVDTGTGTVTGGAGGVTQGRGAQGDAVLFGGTIAGTLMAGPGAKFVGNIVGTYGIANVIELTGSASSAFAGVGVSIIGIADFSFASGAERSLEGSAYGLDFANITGLAVHDTIIVDGFTASLKDTSADPGPYLNLVSSSGDIDIGINRATAKELLITDAGGKTTITAAMPSSARTISGTQGEFVGAGANAASTTIKTGGFEEVYNGGTASATTIAGGELLLRVGSTAKGGIAFTTITGGDLEINTVTMPTTTITGFISGDTIDLAGITYNKNDTVTVATAGTVTIEAPGISYKLDIVGATVGESDFVLSAGNGTLLTKSKAKAMAFVAAPGTLSATHSEGIATMSGAAANLPAAPSLDAIDTQHFGFIWHGQTVQVAGISTSVDLIDRTRIDFIALAHHGAGFG